MRKDSSGRKASLKEIRAAIQTAINYETVFIAIHADDDDPTTKMIRLMARGRLEAFMAVRDALGNGGIESLNDYALLVENR